MSFEIWDGDVFVCITYSQTEARERYEEGFQVYLIDNR